MKIDKRTKTGRKIESFKRVLKQKWFWAMELLAVMIAVVLTVWLWRTLNPSPQPPQAMIQVVEAYETPCDFDAITYIRCSGEKLGKTNNEITTMIRIARAESNFREKAKNANSTASGVFQIIYGTWNSNNCQGNAFNFVNNIDCAWKIETARGFQPWNASKGVWNK